MGRRSRREAGRSGAFRPGLAGCLLWILIVLAVVLVLALFFGGFRKGTKAGSLPGPPAATVSVALAAG